MTNGRGLSRSGHEEGARSGYRIPRCTSRPRFANSLETFFKDTFPGLLWGIFNPWSLEEGENSGGEIPPGMFHLCCAELQGLVPDPPVSNESNLGN